MLRRYLLSGVLAALAVAPSALAASLPTVESGERPGPPLLYAKPSTAPQLSVASPFRARPLLVSGTDAYRRGEYLYQDYLFDDHGANTVGGVGNTSKPGPDTFSASGGDVAYPTDPRFAANAADLVELRIKPTARHVVYRVTLNTVKDSDAAVVGIGIDTDLSGGPAVSWPGGAGVSSPGLDRFIRAWGTGGRVTRLPGGDSTDLPAGSVSISTRTNQMTIRVPRSVMDPGRRTWRYVAGVGLRSGTGFRAVPARSSPTEDEPASGDDLEAAPGVFNLAFRFDEPTVANGLPDYDTLGTGNWFEDKQGRLLKERRTGNFRADVDFGELEDGASRSIHDPPPFEQARIYSSRLEPHEGVRAGFPEFGGRLQPYLLTVPSKYRPGRPTGLTFSLHSLSGTYTQYAVFSPKQQRQFGEQRDDFVVTTLGRGPDGWYTDEAEVDFFEVWADVARRFTLDPTSVALTGYSMGGYGTYKLGTQYPDLFGRAFTTVGPPGYGIWFPPAPPSGGQDTNSNLVLENARWVPYLNWVTDGDDLVPYLGPREQQSGALLGRGFDTLRLRSLLETFQGEHFTLAVLDEWGAARDFLGRARVKRSPSRVNYALLPAADRPKLGLVHDHAYWVSDLRARDRGGDPDADPGRCPPEGGCPPRAEIDAFSMAFGLGREPETERVTAAGTSGRPQPSSIEGTRWTRFGRIEPRNRLLLDLENMSRATIDGRRARLSGPRALRVRLTSDGAARVRLNLALSPCARARRLSAGGGTAAAPEVALSRRGATFEASAGTREYLISGTCPARRPPGAGGGDPRFTG